LQSKQKRTANPSGAVTLPTSIQQKRSRKTGRAYYSVLTPATTCINSVLIQVKKQHFNWFSSFLPAWEETGEELPGAAGTGRPSHGS